MSRLIADTDGRPTTAALTQLAEQYDSSFVDVAGSDTIRLDNEE